MEMFLVNKPLQTPRVSSLSKTSNCGDMIGVFGADSGVYVSPFPAPTQNTTVYFNT